MPRHPPLPTAQPSLLGSALEMAPSRVAAHLAQKELLEVVPSGGFSDICPTWKKPWVRSKTDWEGHLSHLALERLGILQEELESVAEEGRQQHPVYPAAKSDPRSDKRKIMDGCLAIIPLSK